MKKLILLAIAAVMSLSAFAQNLNGAADNILGEYSLTFNGYESKVRVTKSSDGTYMAKVFWVKDGVDAKGKKLLDEKNPDKSLRSTPADQIVLFKGLKYDADKQHWSGAKIYDPTRGIKAHATCLFVDSETLRVRGTLLGIGESVNWKKIKP